jgi:hypothetical protein
MNDYAYQIKGALESVSGRFFGFQVIVCNASRLETVTVPATVLDKETVKYMEFRMKLTADPINIQRLPIKIQNKIRVPLGNWLDRWVLKNFYGDYSNKQDLNS